ncbi:tRNA (adenosine(37)-N6)-threonylcarbamoyltransferase complex ATPase subunit type 1 TsaE [Dyadobacter sp. CY323]|uniref:tRNA (adenosine(37)-N6)-threonylcarbamoyltransferase complex ATPase subunit type 1 TsaE n=1 Tax=Dyadobacter sp. CY323 TaxID=2907302 RepID=UPI001F014A51|nr:tRNA (adenosine(37)-N6)-threonylcarbamoyltransferase complex ATPase subunit type 1 TsaE [Dyadobacter sp. CY323]MCE6991534.1 tRNA (adenosine(37)-N6)-threonylcarbamoyltransferase complex ATPase subunit type 1 TsaE [Dyadobacter sp. CY323]
MTITFKGLDELDRVAAELLETGGNIPVWLFEGQIGAGKTTLIKALCKALGVRSHVQSPTFSLVNEYDAGDRLVYHFDFYRIKDETEALDMGVEEYFDSGEYCFVEWPDKIESLWPASYLKLHLQADESGIRVLEVVKV